MATHSSILVWRIPQREAWQAKVHRVARITAEAIENSHTVKLSGLGVLCVEKVSNYRYTFPKLTQAETENLNSPISH